jgi:hypothetical protein
MESFRMVPSTSTVHVKEEMRESVVATELVGGKTTLLTTP